MAVPRRTTEKQWQQKQRSHRARGCLAAAESARLGLLASEQEPYEQELDPTKGTKRLGKSTAEKILYLPLVPTRHATQG